MPPQASTAIAVVTEARPATEPTDRSIWAAAMTNVTATAMIEIGAVWRDDVRAGCSTIRKPSSDSAIAKTTKTTTNAM